MRDPWPVVDLFSGAGGMSCGFQRHPDFTVIGAADAQIGKPSAPPGALGCNASYQASIGVRPVTADLAVTDPAEVCRAMRLGDARPAVLTACPPCTGFSRAMATNHLRDDRRNGLVAAVGDYAALLRPDVIIVENARELVMGRFAGHLRALTRRLAALGYQVSAGVYFLDAFGLPQRRERAIVMAARQPLRVRNLTALWHGWRVDRKATHVRRAIWDLPPVPAGQAHPGDPLHVSPAFRSAANRRRLAAVPHDGGSWSDLRTHPDASVLLTPAMAGRVARGDLGSHPDIYGRLHWDRPAVTIKRECGHIGNGRYAHPEQDRLCTVREMAILQGFPRDYRLTGSVANMYRHVGDAVPPLLSYQLASLCRWILTGEQPAPEELILAGCHLTSADLQRAG
ncbi:MAG TPA: DNA cytosine methyltransferase [Streptosporangiaceae bacterium]|nr:DNA cytosine methyltransferase [Streptosporangiaceae bacterium]